MMDYHSILGLKQGASKDEIRKAYRKLAFQYHPDKNPSPSAKQKFIEITEAYDGLMSGKAFSFTKQFRTASKPATPHKPKPTTTQDRKAHYHHELHKKFMDLRAKYNHPKYVEQKKKELYGDVQRKTTIAWATGVGVNLFPLIILTPFLLCLTIPIGLGLWYREYLNAERKRAKADMLFGKEQIYSTEELQEFFDIPSDSNGIRGWTDVGV